MYHVHDLLQIEDLQAERLVLPGARTAEAGGGFGTSESGANERQKTVTRAIVYRLLLPEEPASDFQLHDTQTPLDLLSSRYLFKPSAKALSAGVLPHFISWLLFIFLRCILH